MNKDDIVIRKEFSHKMVYENVVVGSGISALGCIVGLLKSKKKVLCIDGSENNLELLNKSENKEIEFSEDETTQVSKKNDFIYSFLSSLRQKINDPLGKRKK